MAAKQGIGVIGLGKFGRCLAESLVELGHTVLGVDMDTARVNQAKSIIPQVFVADGTDKMALQQLGFGDLAFVIVSSGKSMEASILITLNLKELGAETIWVKAVSEEHEKVMRKLGVDLVVFPERFVAQQLAHRLAVPGVMNFMPLGYGVALREITVDHWSGKNLRELDLTNQYGLQVVAIRKAGQGQLNYVPNAMTQLEKGDLLLTIGKEGKMANIKP